MFSHLNTLIGFAAIFAILSLLVTSLTQLVRALLRMKTQALVQCLERLFGELKEPRRFIAAMLSHPSLEGQRGAPFYRILIDPKSDAKAVSDATDAVLGKIPDQTNADSLTAGFRQFTTVPWARTLDLDKQTVKDIGQTVYEQIGHLVDYSLEEGVTESVKEWAAPLRNALERAHTRRLEALASPPASASTAATAFPANSPGGAGSGAVSGGIVHPFRGRLWALATAAFPEAEGKTPPLKTYVAAFHDEADSSASDSFTWRIRLVTLAVSLLVAFMMQLDAVKIWRDMAGTDPNRLAALAQSLQSLGPKAAADSTTNSTAGSLDNTRQALISEIGALKQSNLNLTIRPGIPWGTNANDESFFGFLLAIMALSLGAPFWFEILKSGIQLKSAFADSNGK